MCPRQWRLLLYAAMVLTVLPCFGQGATEHLLPDAPQPADRVAASRERPERAELKPYFPTARKQMTPSFSTSLSAREKYQMAYRRIVSPQMPLKALFVSGFEMAAGTGPDFPTNGWVPFAERAGYNALSISTTVFFNTAFVPAMAKQDPRYFVLGSGPVKSRVAWAVKSEFVGVGDDGHAMPNYANLVGFALSSIAINAFSPRGSVGYGDTVERYAIKVGVSTGLNVAREFGLFDRVNVFARHSKTDDEPVDQLDALMNQVQ